MEGKNKQKGSIVFTPDFLEITDDLAFVMFIEGYFGFIEDAEKYINKIYDYIEENIFTYPSKNTPKNLSKYGEKYMIYKANNNTTWYIFFSQINSMYAIKFITNNHSNFISQINL